MATAEEMLANELGEGKTLVIDVENRTIIIPETLTHLGVESDDDVLRLDFRMPRYYGEFDLSIFKIRINYLNANGAGDLYEVEDDVVSNDTIMFSWLVGRSAAAFAGNVNFNVCLKKYDTEDDTEVDQEWNTTVATLPVLVGLETSEAIIQQNADIVEKWKREIYEKIDKYVNDYFIDHPLGEDVINEYVIDNNMVSYDEIGSSEGGSGSIGDIIIGSSVNDLIEDYVTDNNVVSYDEVEDGVGSNSGVRLVQTVNNVSPDSNGNVNFSYSDLKDIPKSFTPSQHNHTASEVTDLSKVAKSGAYADLSGAPNVVISGTTPANPVSGMIWVRPWSKTVISYGKTISANTSFEAFNTAQALTCTSEPETISGSATYTYQLSIPCYLSVNSTAVRTLVATITSGDKTLVMTGYLPTTAGSHTVTLSGSSANWFGDAGSVYLKMVIESSDTTELYSYHYVSAGITLACTAKTDGGDGWSSGTVYVYQ